MNISSLSFLLLLSFILFHQCVCSTTQDTISVQPELTYTTSDTIITSTTKCDPPCGEFGRCLKKDSKNGTDEYYCSCVTKYYGDDCKSKWDNDPTWHICFLALSILVVILQLILLVWSGFQISLTFKHAKKRRWSRWSIATWTLALIFLGSLIRIIEYAVDPHAVREIFPPVAEEILYTIPLILWLSAGHGLFLYWIELSLLTGAQEIQFVKKLRKFLYMLVITTIVLLVPACIAKVLVNRFISLIIYNIAFAIMFIVFLVMILTFGTRLKRRMERAYVSTRVQACKVFVIKMTVFIYIACILFTVALVMAILFLIVGSNRWGYFVLHTIFRIDEFGIMGVMLYLFSKKVPKDSGYSTGSYSSGGDFSSNAKSINLSLSAEETGDTVTLPPSDKVDE